jgi:hypothetical protein
MEASIAGISVWGSRPGEESFVIQVAIGQPFRCGDDPEEWECPVEISPLYRRLRGAHANDSLQAICLTLSLVLELLTDFQQKGGSLGYEPGDASFSLEPYAFGRALGTKG